MNIHNRADDNSDDPIRENAGEDLELQDRIAFEREEREGKEERKTSEEISRQCARFNSKILQIMSKEIEDLNEEDLKLLVDSLVEDSTIEVFLSSSNIDDVSEITGCYWRILGNYRNIIAYIESNGRIDKNEFSEFIEDLGQSIFKVYSFGQKGFRGVSLALANVGLQAVCITIGLTTSFTWCLYGGSSALFGLFTLGIIAYFFQKNQLETERRNQQLLKMKTFRNQIEVRYMQIRDHRDNLRQARDQRALQRQLKPILGQSKRSIELKLDAILRAVEVPTENFSVDPGSDGSPN